MENIIKRIIESQENFTQMSIIHGRCLQLEEIREVLLKMIDKKLNNKEILLSLSNFIGNKLEELTEEFEEYEQHTKTNR